MAAGLTNKAIGLRLEISANTVKYHVNTILSKLGAQSRTGGRRAWKPARDSSCSKHEVGSVE
ncbi:MAG: response regulator transcription factor [Chloroflexi bacterium]|nr:response regulator transcription factor [Chloroflexota bacterium]